MRLLGFLGGLGLFHFLAFFFLFPLALAFFFLFLLLGNPLRLPLLFSPLGLILMTEKDKAIESNMSQNIEQQKNPQPTPTQIIALVMNVCCKTRKNFGRADKNRIGKPEISAGLTVQAGRREENRGLK